jgi:hypothetical protein
VLVKSTSGGLRPSENPGLCFNGNVVARRQAMMTSPTASLAARSLDGTQGLPCGESLVSGNRGEVPLVWIACVVCAENPVVRPGRPESPDFEPTARKECAERTSSNKNKAGGACVSMCRPSLRATPFGACGSPALLCRADQHHRRRWLLAQGSPWVNEKSPAIGLPTAVSP